MPLHPLEIMRKDLHASEIKSRSLTNIDTKPKMTMKPLKTAIAIVNFENSPGISSTDIHNYCS